MHAVRAGETLSSIALSLWGSYARTADLIRWNWDRIENPSLENMADGRFNVIRPGMQLLTEEPAQPPAPLPVAPPVPAAEPSGGSSWGWLLVVLIGGALLLRGGRNGKKK